MAGRGGGGGSARGSLGAHGRNHASPSIRLGPEVDLVPSRRPRARKGGAAALSAGRAGPEPLPAGASREGGSEPASQRRREGAAPAHARRAPPHLPRLLDSAREEGKGGGGADGPRAARPVTAPARAGGRGGDDSH